jgi:hypothetical protein
MNSSNNATHNNLRWQTLIAKESIICGGQIKSLVTLGLEQNNPNVLKIISQTLEELDQSLRNSKSETDVITILQSVAPTLAQRMYGSYPASRIRESEIVIDPSKANTIPDDLKALKNTVFLSSDFLTKTPLLQAKLWDPVKHGRSAEIFINTEAEVAELILLLRNDCCENLFYLNTNLRSVVINLPSKNKIIELSRDQLNSVQIHTTSKDTGLKTKLAFSNSLTIEALEVLFVDQLKQKFIEHISPKIEMLTNIEVLNQSGNVCQNPKENLLAIMKLIGFNLTSEFNEKGEVKIIWKQNATAFPTDPDSSDAFTAAIKYYFNSEMINKLDQPINPQEIPFLLKDRDYSYNPQSKTWGKKGIISTIKKLFQAA